MNQYLLSTYRVEGHVPGAPASPEEMQTFMQRIIELEAEMESTGAFVFGGGLHSHDASTVVSRRDGRPVMSDGPFADAKEHLAGFYVINAEDLDAALVWADKVVAATNHPIEVRAFQATGFVKDHLPANG